MCLTGDIYIQQVHCKNLLQDIASRKTIVDNIAHPSPPTCDALGMMRIEKVDFPFAGVHANAMVAPLASLVLGSLCLGYAKLPWLIIQNQAFLSKECYSSFWRDENFWMILYQMRSVRGLSLLAIQLFHLGIGNCHLAANWTWLFGQNPCLYVKKRRNFIMRIVITAWGLKWF